MTLSATADGAKEATQNATQNATQGVTENPTENPTVHGTARATEVPEGIGLLLVAQHGYRMFGEGWYERAFADHRTMQTFSQRGCRAYGESA